MNSNSPRVLRMLETARSLGLAPGARVLVVAHDAADLVPPVRDLGFAPVAADPRQPVTAAAASFDAAILIDALERTEWDRWLLQQVRRTLVPDAPLVLFARNLWSLATPWEAAGLAGRIVRVLLGRAGRKIAPPRQGAPASRSPFRGRKYRGHVLTAMLRRLGYEIESCEGGRQETDWRVVARARDRGILGGSVPLGTCAEHTESFERENEDFLRARAAWAERHPEAVPRRVEVLDPSAYAHATAVVLSPHPDDEIIGCGGTLLRLARAGCHIVSVQATDGGDGWALREATDEVRRSVRITEAREVARAAGIGETDFWRADNRAFHPSEGMVDRLSAMLTRLQPRLLFTPFLTDVHPDHLTLNAIAAGAILAAPDALEDCRVLGYEVWALAPAGVVCDVTDVRAEQEALLWRYETAMKVDDFIELCERRNYYNACRLLGRAGYAEAFHVCRAGDYPALVTATYQRRPTASV